MEGFHFASVVLDCGVKKQIRATETVATRRKAGAPAASSRLAALAAKPKGASAKGTLTKAGARTGTPRSSKKSLMDLLAECPVKGFIEPMDFGSIEGTGTSF